MHKIFLLVLLYLGLTVPFTAMSETNPVLRMFGISENEQPTLSPEMLKGLEEVSNLIQFSCFAVYPRPTTAECIDRVKHGIGASFDPHSGYMNVEELKKFNEETTGEFGGVGIEISKASSTAPLVVVNVIDDAPASRAGVLAGDIILNIITPDGKNIAVSSLKNSGDVVKLLRGTPNTTVAIKVARMGADNPIQINITREIIKVAQVKGDLIQSGNRTYALIQNKQFSRGNKDAMRAKYFELSKRAHGKLSGLIVSVENNPGGLLYEVYKGVDLFLDAKSIVLIKNNEQIEELTLPRTELTPGDITNGLPMLVVVNGGSASASEIFSAAMKHFGRAVIVGTGRTFGKGIVQSAYQNDPALVPGTSMKLTSSEYLIGTMDDWIPVQCIGVTPDILFEYSGIKNRERPTECDMNEHVNSGGAMANPPLHRPINESNPKLYKAAEEMLEAYKAYRTPQLLEEEAKRKALEAK